jgi:hypothetical protein
MRAYNRELSNHSGVTNKIIKQKVDRTDSFSSCGIVCFVTQYTQYTVHTTRFDNPVQQNCSNTNVPALKPFLFCTRYFIFQQTAEMEARYTAKNETSSLHPVWSETKLKH